MTVLALLAWAGLLLAHVPLHPSMPAMGGLQQAASHAGAPAAAHCDTCRGHGSHTATGSAHGACCGCLGLCAGVIQPAAVAVAVVAPAHREAPRPRRVLLAAFLAAPPLRPPAA